MRTTISWGDSAKFGEKGQERLVLFDWRDLQTSCILSVNHGSVVPSPIGEIMIDAIVAWDAEDDPDGNVQHIIEHGITMEEVEEVLLNENNPVGESRSSGRPLTFGKTTTGKHITVVWEQALDNPLVIRPITAYETDEGR
jgi:uncharacterized DUF497 family protein